MTTQPLSPDATANAPNGRRGGGVVEPAANPVPPPRVAYSDARTAIVQGDVRASLHTLPPDSIDCVVTSPPYWGLRDYGLPAVVWEAHGECDHAWASEGNCMRCGAWRGQLGLEPSPELYVQHMVEVFRDVRRVLKPQGTAWVNLGDCYNACTNAPRAPSENRVGYWQAAGSMGDRRVKAAGLKAKDLVGIPWRVALALQADGWYLRSDVIWAKPNPVPEGVRDRPVRAHEYLFLFSKEPRYFYDAEALRENADSAHSDKDARAPDTTPGACRARHSVWNIPTQRYNRAHFATFPERLVEPCILAGTSALGCCPACGAAWKRSVHVSYTNPGNRRSNGPRSLERKKESPGFSRRLIRFAQGDTWQSSCECERTRVPATVLDPFAGSGTTLAVARRLGRRAIGIELNPDYVKLARERVRAIGPQV